MKFTTDDVRITGMEEVIAPKGLITQLPITSAASRLVFDARKAAAEIIHGRDDRLIVIVGPCSIHDPDAAREYATRLKPLADRLSGALQIIMRVYFEKPRTTVGWKDLSTTRTSTTPTTLTEALSLHGSCCSILQRQVCPPGRNT